MMKTIKINGLGDLYDAAGEILDSLEGRTIVALRGEMGAGKTTLIREICDRLGVADTVTSPTFAIINEYKDRGHRPVSTGSIGSRRRSISVTRSISTVETCAWSNGRRRSSS